MAGCKIVTRKMMTFQGGDEEFSNVYYFGDGDVSFSPTEAEALALIDAVIAAEKNISASSIRFLGGVAYKIGAANTPGRTDAIAIRELAATGNQGTFGDPSAVRYRECAEDLKLLLGGRKYLRTLIHTNANHGFQTSGELPITTTVISAGFKAFAEKMLNGPWPGGFQRINPDGDRPTAIMYNPFLEHRQFHRYRRRNRGLLA